MIRELKIRICAYVREPELKMRRFAAVFSPMILARPRYCRSLEFACELDFVPLYFAMSDKIFQLIRQSGLSGAGQEQIVQKIAAASEAEVEYKVSPNRSNFDICKLSPTLV